MNTRIQTYTNQPRNFYVHKQLSLKSKSDADNLPENKNTKTEQNTKYNLKSNIALTTFLSIGCLLMFSKGFQKNAGKYLNKFKEYLEGKLETSSVQKSGKRTKFIKYSIRGLNSFIQKSESINNITSLKDVLFMKLMYKTKPTKKIHNTITKYFESLSRKTVTSSYKETEESFKRMNKIFDKLDKKILENSPDEEIEYKGKTYTKRALVEMAKGNRDIATTVVKAFIDKSALDVRYKYINDVTSTLYAKFWDASFKDFWSKNNKFQKKEMWQTFIAAEQIKGNKTELGTNVSSARSIISYNEADKTKLIQDYINNFKGIISFSDKEGMNIINKLLWFTKHPEGLKENKDVCFRELDKLDQHKITGDLSQDMISTQEVFKKINIDLIRRSLDDFDSSAIKDMLSIYYRIAPLELSKSKGEIALKNAVKSFDKSVNLEIVEFFDKVRDLRLGSAPTDVLTVILSFLVLTFGLGYTKDKDERNSMMLTSGIPIIGAIATSLISTTKLVSGGKSLFLGFVSGIILNKIGKIADNIRKQKQTYNKTVS